MLILAFILAALVGALAFVGTGCAKAAPVTNALVSAKK